MDGDHPLKPVIPPRGSRRWLFALRVTFLLLSGAGLWWLLQPSAGSPGTNESADDSVAPTTETIATPPATPAVPAAPPRPAPPPVRANDEADGGDGVAIMGPGDSDSSERGPRHPHPITAEHKRIFHENDLIASLNGAMDAGDFRVMRRLNAQYRSEFPEDDHVMQEGYDLIADCLERRSPRTQAAAARFTQVAIASTLRRYVQRHCLQ